MMKIIAKNTYLLYALIQLYSFNVFLFSTSYLLTAEHLMTYFGFIANISLAIYRFEKLNK